MISRSGSQSWRASLACCCFLLLNLVFIPSAWAVGVLDIPLLDPNKPTWVLDQAEVISPFNQGKLNGQLNQLAKETGNQLHLLTVRRLDYGETPQTIADKLFERWFPEPDQQANQAILILDTVTNVAAIHAGPAAHALLTPEIATSVADESMRIPLRDNNYNQAFLDATERMVAVLQGQPDPGPPEVKVVNTVEGTFASAEETDDKSATILVVVLLVVATVVPMATYFWYQSGSS